LKKEPVKLNWVGSQFDGHSLAIVNQNICRYLQDHQTIELRKDVPEKEKSLPPFIESDKNQFMTFSDPDLTISHQWPPIWSRTKSGFSVYMQPWEFGSIPREWYIPMKYWVDEIWVYSSYNKDSYIRSGIPASKVHIIPLGVDEKIFHLNVEPFKLDLSSFNFLFVGGTIGRKGIDILLHSYLKEFTAEDDVCLFIKDTGTQSFYKGITLDKMIHEAMSDTKNPRIVYMDQQLAEAELAGLYTACDCLVHPYRGEGFGLPIAEAMACGTPVIVPDKGSCRDFCNEETAFFVPSNEVDLAEKRVGNMETVDFPWWLSIEVSDLQRVMRLAYDQGKLVKEKGKKASLHILSNFTWKKSAEHVIDRMNQLVGRERFTNNSDEEIIKVELELAKQLYADRQTGDALGLFLNIIATYPSSLIARYNAAVIYMEQNNYLKSLVHLTYIATNMKEQGEGFKENILNMMRYCYLKESESKSE